MNYLKQALTELLSGLTTKKNEKETWTTSEYGWPTTVEPIDDEHYILRIYYANGKLWWEDHYKNDQLHGVCKGWHDSGKLWWEDYWENGIKCRRIK